MRVPEILLLSGMLPPNTGVTGWRNAAGNWHLDAGCADAEPVLDETRTLADLAATPDDNCVCGENPYLFEVRRLISDRDAEAVATLTRTFRSGPPFSDAHGTAWTELAAVRHARRRLPVLADAAPLLAANLVAYAVELARVDAALCATPEYQTAAGHNLTTSPLNTAPDPVSGAGREARERWQRAVTQTAWFHLGPPTRSGAARLFNLAVEFLDSDWRVMRLPSAVLDRPLERYGPHVVCLADGAVPIGDVATTWRLCEQDPDTFRSTLDALHASCS